ncbi:lipid droplet-associated hydrolase isoform X2 [Jatropha curcas]|uniref:lipid droplet-associated hydrolase isoform X2 n=1 Tax=Jatropha curcas TaxID=180498 RepID=UPI0005FAC113|nr:lipid droplet-associated hydrolase isoform X2 [Jatropha curcas]
MQCVQVYCFLIFLFYLLAVIVYAFYLFDDFVLSYKTELLEIRSDDPKLHVLFIPGNPGVVSFYKDFLESLYELLGGTASVTAIGHISHTKKNWERGRLFSLQQQIDHKVDFIEQERKTIGVPIVLVGHSIGSYISIETLRRSPEVKYFIGLYPFLMLNPLSEKQTKIKKLAESSIRSDLLSFSIASLGVLPRCISRIIVSNSIGKSWSATAVDAACSHLLQYHSFRNMIFMALTEFRKLSETPNWEFMRENQSKMAFLFGVDDHWGPLEMFEEIAKQVPGITLSIEREGHTHSFCCTEAGSSWVAQHVANLIKNQILGSC